jgi:Membrane-fusion protein
VTLRVVTGETAWTWKARSLRRLPRTSIFPTARPFPRFSSKRAMW